MEGEGRRVIKVIKCYYFLASKPEHVDMLPHIRGQGIMDLEFESDGNGNFDYISIKILNAFLFLEDISAPPAYRHDVSYVMSHKGPVLCATFSHDGKFYI